MSINLTYKPAAYVNFCTVDAAIGFYGKIPAGYEGVYQSGYVDELRGEIERLNQQVAIYKKREAALMEQEPAAEGYVLAPVEPTKEMINAAYYVSHDGCKTEGEMITRSYKAMLEAAKGEVK